MPAPTFIDLFCGAGLFSAGMMAAGFEPVMAVEWDRDAAESYRRNVSPVVARGSVADFSGCPKAEVVIGGPPCQGYSPLGKRDPQDERNRLALAMLPWIDAADPSFVVIENVPKFVRSDHWMAVEAALGERGYDVSYWHLDAADFGTPQRRRRAFTVGSRVGRPVPPFELRRVTATAGEALSRPFRTDDPMHVWTSVEGVVEERIALIPPKGDRRDIERLRPDLSLACWKGLGSNTTDVYGRIDADAPAPTLRCRFQYASTGRFLHPTENRGISLREGARLQGIPDDWDLAGSVTSIAKQVGNGVPLPLGRAIGEAVMGTLLQARASMPCVSLRHVAAAALGSASSLASPERSSPARSKASSSARYSPRKDTRVADGSDTASVTSASNPSSFQPA